MGFWKNYYHLVWTTKYRQAVINKDIELFIYSVIHRLSQEELGSKIYALNGTSDHVHVAVAIPPKLSVSDWVKHVKGTSSNAVNKTFISEDSFAWQPSFGSMTYGSSQMSFVIQYIEKQKEHHANNTTNSYLERTDDD
jgi:putative transposase